MNRDEVNAWIMARKAEGLWVRVCLSCGSWFAQPHAGRPANACNRQVCILAYRWQRKNGAMPPDWLWRKWRLELGDAERKQRPTSSLRYATVNNVTRAPGRDRDAA